MDNKYKLDTKENISFMKALCEDLLQFGKQFPAQEGGSYYLGDDGSPWKEKGVETWITCRMAHVYSIGAMLGMEGADALVMEALRGLNGILKDRENGGWYPGVKENGEKMPTKQCYAHAFVILAASSAYLAGIEGGKELLEQGLEVYDKYFWDSEAGLAYDTYNTEFTLLDDYRGINANMHTVEAFLAVADALADDSYRQRAGRIIDHVIAWAKDNQWRIPEHYTKEWKVNLAMNKEKPDDPFKPYGATPGHGIEWARLISQWALSTYGHEAEAMPYIEAAKALFDRAMADGWNADGALGIVYTTDWDGKPVVRDRMHWTLAEAINTSAVLFRVTGEEKYRNIYGELMEYLDHVVLDHVNGSWFHQLDENNKLKNTVWPGKSDIYHALQSTIIPYGDVSISIASYVKGMSNR